MYLDAVQTRREEGRPKLYTEKELETIVSYVSRRPQFHPLGTRLQFPDPEKFDQNTRAIQDRVRAEQKQSLADRIEKPSLKERISQAKASATYTPIAPKPILIDFKKHTVAELIGIFKPKAEATSTRLKAISELLDQLEHHVPHAQAVIVLNDRLYYLLEHLEEVIAGATHAQLQSLDWGLKSIGLISFKSLRHNFSHVLSEVARVAQGGYFDWTPL